MVCEEAGAEEIFQSAQVQEVLVKAALKVRETEPGYQHVQPPGLEIPKVEGSQIIPVSEMTGSEKKEKPHLELKEKDKREAAEK